MRGRGLGFPTANLKTPPHAATPADGVYAGWLNRLSLEGSEVSRWPAAISVSINPTFGGGDRTVEAYALDRNDLDLYGVHVAGDFVAKLRGTRKFDSVDALVSQIHKDVIQARDLTVGLLADGLGRQLDLEDCLPEHIPTWVQAPVGGPEARPAGTHGPARVLPLPGGREPSGRTSGLHLAPAAFAMSCSTT
jgi:hypothetical protein